MESTRSRRGGQRLGIGIGIAGATGLGTAAAVTALVAGALAPAAGPAVAADGDAPGGTPRSVEITAVDLRPGAGKYLKIDEQLDQVLIVQPTPDFPDEPFAGPATRADATAAILTSWQSTTYSAGDAGVESVDVSTPGFVGVEIYGDRAAATAAWDAKYAPADVYGSGVLDPAPAETERWIDEESGIAGLFELPASEVPGDVEGMITMWESRAAELGLSSAGAYALGALDAGGFNLSAPEVRLVVFEPLQQVEGVDVSSDADADALVFTGSTQDGTTVELQVDASRGIVTSVAEYEGARAGGLVPDDVPDVTQRFDYETVTSAP